MRTRHAFLKLSFYIEKVRTCRDRRSALTALRRLNREDKPYKHAEHLVLLDAMKNAAFREDRNGTTKVFHNLRALAPEVAIRSETAIRSLLAIGEIDLAESVLEEGLRKYPGDYILMLLHADVAGCRGNWLEADRRWKAMRRRFPDDYWACYWGAVALKEIGQLDEADRLMGRAIATEPHQAISAAEYARIAECRGDQQEALRRWELMRERIEDQSGWVGCARIMCRLDRENEAIELLTKARWRFQTRPEPLIELAEIHLRLGSTEEATRLWQAVREQFPHNEQGYTRGAHVLQELGRQAEAEVILQQYATRTNPA